MNKKFFPVILFLLVVLTGRAQEQKTDTVIVPLANTSKVIFTVKDRADLEILKHYNFQEMFQDIIKRIEKSDSVAIDSTTSQPVAAEQSREENWNTHTEANHDDDDDAEWEHISSRRNHFGRTWQSFNFDLGTNNYLSDGKFPDNDNAIYAVRPWGSWYLAASSIQRTRMGKNFFLEWGLGLSWYNFKFQNDNAMLQKTDNGVEFISDLREVDHIKSKLTVSYLNASLVPVLDFGDHGRKPRLWDGYRSEFRIGLGPYIGYRISSHSKIVYKEDGDREKDKDHNSFYLNNIRYGARLQLGFRSTDLFFNYDMNELFVSGKGPSLNAFSFGVIF
jgi:hypothetical protein